MVKVPLKGVHRVVSRLADGRALEYHYAWRGGPRLSGKPGSPEYVESYRKAHEGRRQAPQGEFRAIIAEFRGSSDFKGLSAASTRAYSSYLKLIEAQFGDLPLPALADPEMRGEFMRWRDGMAETPRKADYAWTVLARVCSFAKNRGRIRTNPCERGGRLYEADRTEILWTEDHLSRLFAACSKEVRAAVIFALWTGQRQGDVLRMPWSALADGKLRFRQGKTKRRVTVPLSETLADLLADLPRLGPVILTSSDKRPWTSDGFRASFRKACARAGIEDQHFNDLRGTAVSRLALAGCSALEIASITGHSERDVSAMLDRHYLGDRNKLAEAAIVKLDASVRRTETGQDL